MESALFDTLRRLREPVEAHGVRRIWTRTPWEPRRLVKFAAVLGLLWLLSILVGGPSKDESLICDVGGSCASAFARGVLAAGGAAAGAFALILVAVAGVRWARARRRAD